MGLPWLPRQGRCGARRRDTARPPRYTANVCPRDGTSASLWVISHRVPVVADAAAGLDDDEVEPQRQPREWRAVRQRPAIEQAVSGCPDARPLPVIDRLLGQTERPVGAPADLDHHERGGRTRVDRHEVELVTTDMDVPGQDEPASLRESVRDERLGGITRLLRRRSSWSAGLILHRRMVAGAAYRPCIGPVGAWSLRP